MRIYRRCVWAFFVFYFISSIGIAVLTPPFAEPDGFAHWWRMITLGEDRFLPSNQDGLSGLIVRRSAARLVRLTVDGIAFHPENKMTNRLAAALELKQGRPQIFESDAVGTFANLPTLYALPSLLARLADISTNREYIAAIGYRVLALTLLAAALFAFRPPNLVAYGVFLSIPMVQFLIATGHPDAFLIVAAITASLPGPRHRVVSILSLMILASKSACAALLPFHILVRRVSWSSLALSLAALAGVIAIYAAYYRYIGPLADVRLVGSNVNPAAQLALLLHEPGRITGIATETLSANGRFYLASSIGLLGWLDTPIPIWTYGLFAVLAFLACCGSVVERGVIIIWVLVATLYFGAVFAALYLGWTPVGAGTVAGVQGRYFLPALAVIVPFLKPREILTRTWVVISFSAACIALQFNTLAVLLWRYY